MSVLLNTSLGDMVIDLHTEKCPLTTKNFLKLCKIKYYNNCVFHMVQKDFIAQTGDPTGTGSGGDSIYKFLYGDQARFFNDEIHPDLKHDTVGVVAMASAGENLNASQFYITTRADLDYLDGKHTIFGVVAEGEDVLMRINEAYVDEKSRPFKNIRIKHTYILDDPFEDPAQLAELIPDSSPELRPPAEGEEVRLEDDWVPMDEQLNAEELERSLRQKEAHSRAVVLEMVGDIPEAEIKPPENVLFVCKLNPVTQEEDLEVIFSRFGKVVSADIIRDYKTGDSLCYAFIEFETQEACESAYFKMDNVLIDDRRIHVDFSQSVSQLWTRYRRFGTKDKDDGGGRSFVPNAKGQGCFKCGEMGHMARDCTNDGKNEETIQERPKYELKDRSGQHGGTGKRYDMVFEHPSPEGRKHARKSHHENGRSTEDVKSHSSLSSRKSIEDSHRREHTKRDREEKHMNHSKSREYKGRIDEESDADGKRPHDIDGKRDDRYHRSDSTRHAQETSPDYKHRDRHGRLDDHRSDRDHRRGDRHSHRNQEIQIHRSDRDRERDNHHSHRISERDRERKSEREISPEGRHSRKEKVEGRERDRSRYTKDKEYKRRRADESE